MNEFQTIPCNEEAERFVLGAMLLDPSLIPQVEDMLSPAHYFTPAHQVIADTMYELALSGEVHIMALRDALAETAQLEQIGGAEYLTRLVTDCGWDATNTAYHARAVRNAAVLRQLHSMGQALMSDASRATTDGVDELLQKYQSDLFALDIRADRGDSLVEVGQAARDAIRHADRVAAGEISPGLMTGFGHIDRIVGGAQPGDLWVLAGATSVGKTATALAITANVARAGGGVLYVSLEMDRQAIANRLLGAEAQIEGRRLRCGNLNEAELESRDAAAKAMAGWRLAILDKATTVGEIRIRARQMAAKWRKPLDLIVVDHLQLVSPPPGGRHETRAQQVGAIAGALKALAMETSTPILLLSQLNRESVKGKLLPSIHGLKESGDVENSASVVLLLHSPTTDAAGKAETDITTRRFILWARVAKARDAQTTQWPWNGQQGIKLAFRAECARMEVLTL